MGSDWAKELRTAPEERIARLIALNAPLKGKEFPLRSAAISIGRGPDNDIVIDHSKVSRSHARVERIGDRYRLRDLGSRNGIKVNDVSVVETFLEHGDLLSVGDSFFKFIISADAHAPVPPPQSAPPAPSPVPPAQVALRDPDVPRADLLATAAAAEQPFAVQNQGEVRKGVWLTVIVTTVAILLVGGVLAVWLMVGGKPGIQTLELPYVLIQVNENRLVPIVLTVTKDGKPISALVDYRSDSVQVADPSVARVARFEGEKGYFVVTGLAGGETDVTMKSLHDNIIRLKVIVRGRLIDPVELATSRAMTPAERVLEAQTHVQTADRLAARPDLSNALTEYRIASALLAGTPMSSLHLKADEGVTNMGKALDVKYRTLADSIKQAISGRDYAKQTAYLQELLRLIPDKNDPRHQKAEFRLRRLELETESG